MSILNGPITVDGVGLRPFVVALFILADDLSIDLMHQTINYLLRNYLKRDVKKSALGVAYAEYFLCSVC